MWVRWLSNDDERSHREIATMEPTRKKQKMDSATASSTLPNIILTEDRVPVRKVCFSFDHEDLASEQNITTSLLTQIIQIGKIDTMSLRSSSAFTNGIVQFNQPEHAAQLLRQHNLEFAGSVIRFKEATDQPIYGTCTILDLNDDCLQEIFSRFDVKDLASVAEANERFTTAAQAVFALKYKSYEYMMLPGSKSENFVKNFGSFIKKLDIDLNRNVDIHPEYASQLKLIGPHCNNSLDQLYLANFKLNFAILNQIEPVLSRLRSLRLDRCELSGPLNMFISCQELREFGIFASRGNWTFPRCNLPKLEKLCVWNSGAFGARRMEMFLDLNPQLKTVMIRHVNSTDSIIAKIAKYLPLIESIVVVGEQNGYFQPLFCQNAFESLKKLSLQCGENLTTSVIKALIAMEVPLEHLELNVSYVQLIDAICKIKTIKILYLLNAHDLHISHLLRITTKLTELNELLLGGRCFGLNSNDWLTLVSNAKKLRCINLWENEVNINSRTYINLVRIVKERAEVTRLKIIVCEKVYEKLSHYTLHRDTLVFINNRKCNKGYRTFWADFINV